MEAVVPRIKNDRLGEKFTFFLTSPRLPEKIANMFAAIKAGYTLDLIQGKGPIYKPIYMLHLMCSAFVSSGCFKLLHLT